MSPGPTNRAIPKVPEGGVALKQLPFRCPRDSLADGEWRAGQPSRESRGGLTTSAGWELLLAEF